MFKQIVSMTVLVLLLTSCQGQAKEELLREGRVQLEQGNINGAIVLFKNALEQDQSYAQARQGLAEAYWATGKYEKAANELLKVQLQNPGDRSLSLLLAELYTMTGQPEKALEEVKTYLEDEPESSKTHEILGRVFLLQGQPQEAITAMEASIALDAGNLSVRLTLAELMLRRGEVTQARVLLEEILEQDEGNVKALGLLATLEQAAGEIDRALMALERLMVADPGNAQALYMSGFLNLKKGAVAEAEASLARLCERRPDSPESPRLRGLIHFSKQEFAEASSELQRALSLAGDPVTYYFLGLSYYQLGKFELALNQFQKLLDYRPDFVAARFLSALTLFRQGRFDDSIHETKKVLQTHDNLALAHSLLGGALLAKGDFDEATAEIDRAIELDPSLVDAHSKKSILSLLAGDLNLAEQEMLAAVDLAPDILNTRIALGTYYLKRGQMDKALETFKSGVAGNPADAVLLNNAAMVCLAQDNKGLALEYFQMAKEAKPDYLAPHFNLAAVHASSGDYPRAREEYRAVIDKQPGHPRALLGLAQIAEISDQKSQALEYYQALGSSGTVQGVLLLAEYHLRRQEPVLALQTLEDGIRRNPSEPSLLEAKGRVLAGQKRFKEAGASFEEVAMRNPVRGTALLTSVYLQSGETAKAVNVAEELTQTLPQEPATYLVLSSVHQAAGDLASAREALGRGLETHGDHNPIRTQIGRLYEAGHQPDLALKVYEEVLAKSPDFVPALFAKSSLLQFSGKIGAAEAGYRKILELDKNNVGALNNLAFLCADAVDSREEGVRLAWRALRAAPTNPAIMDTLGYALLKSGRSREALKVLEQAATLLPDDAEVQEHLEEALRSAGKESTALTTDPAERFSEGQR